MKQLVFFFSVFFLAFINSAAAMRCNGQLIKPNAEVDQILKLCGEPSYRLKSQDEYKSIDTNKKETFSYIQREEFLYDLGPTVFLKQIILHNGKTVKVGSYDKKGLKTSDSRNCHKNNSVFRRRSSLALIGYICGNPKEKMTVAKEYKGKPGKMKAIVTEHWTYGHDGKKFTVISVDNKFSHITN